MSIVIYGPQGCGKTRHANELALHFRKTQMIDDWIPGDDLPEDALVLTNAQDVDGAIAFAEIMESLKRS